MLGRAWLGVFLGISLSACGGSSTSDGSGHQGGSGGNGGTGGGSGGGTGGNTACPVTAKTALGMHVDFTNPVRCSFTLAEAAAGIQIPYAVVIDQDVSDVVVQSQSSCGQPGASGLIVFEQLSGNGQAYCLCDEGLCASPPQTPVTIKAGSFAQSFGWDGKNWSGPSDTGNPKGPPFPPGTYALDVSAKGTQAGAAFDVQSTLTLTLTP